jgi:hypothetical protein
MLLIFALPVLAKQDFALMFSNHSADLPFQGLATRKPMLLFSLVGLLLLLRFDASKLLELLFQLPPRTPRSDELNQPGRPHSVLPTSLGKRYSEDSLGTLISINFR